MLLSSNLSSRFTYCFCKILPGQGWLLSTQTAVKSHSSFYLTYESQLACQNTPCQLWSASSGSAGLPIGSTTRLICDLTLVCKLNWKLRPLPKKLKLMGALTWSGSSLQKAPLKSVSVCSHSDIYWQPSTKSIEMGTNYCKHRYLRWAW